MKFYILGYETHERGETLRMMTRREFATYEEAAKYASTVHPSWKPFVVATATPPVAALLSDEVWTTREGREMKVGDMTENHVRSTLRLILRRRRELKERMQAHPLKLELLTRLIRQTMRKVSDEQAAEEQRLHDDLMDQIGEDHRWGSD